MKKNIIFCLFVLSLLVGSTSVFAATTSLVGNAMLNFYSIDVTMVNHEPSPAEAGQYVTVRFKVENSGRENAEDLVLELLPKYPFSLDPGESTIQKIGSVHGKQVGDIGVIVDYRLRVDSDAIDGDNELELRYSIGGDAWIKLEPFYINIVPHDVLLSIESVSTTEMIKPGETNEVSINLKNLAVTLIKDIKVTLNLDGSPFATIGSTNRKIIRNMEALSNAEVTFNLMAEPDTESKLYKVPIEVGFLDRLGTEYTKNETVGLIVGAEPDLSVIIDSSDIYSSGGTYDIPVKFVNKGVTDVKFLNVILKGSSNYKILSPSEVYVGNIDSDDYETAEFKISINKVKASEVKLNLEVDYKDANNNDYRVKTNLPLKLYSAGEAKDLDGKKSNSFVGVIIIVVIVAAGFFFYRRWKKKKGKK
ncbi:MAG: COG1361 S-layer family protein [Nanoarchaeota archaeon]|nr:COG1361 S-layer family protein [Nanoarchaeota archaeon]